MEPLFNLVPSPHASYRPPRRRVVARKSHSLAIDMECSIRADTRRLFHALTVPEYLETWLCLPGHPLGCSTAATRINDDYIVEHYCGQRPAIAITGTYLACRRRNVLFSWRVDGDFSTPETRVEIHLQGNFGNTVLTLGHSGFDSAEERAWHKAFWSASIGRLMRLYDLSDSLDSARL